MPPKHITVNLAPADVPKEGSHFDLPIALGMMVAMGVLPADVADRFCVIGELGLDGSIASVSGVLLAALKAGEEGLGLICPAACGPEAAWAASVDVIAAPNLISLVNHLKGVQVLAPPEPRMAEAPANAPDLRDIKGQEAAKRTLEVAAAGGHNLLILSTV